MGKKQYELFKKRRKDFRSLLSYEYNEEQYGVVLLFGALENDRYSFRQDSSLYYLTGITEPGVVLAMYFDGRDVIYLPNFGPARQQWINVDLTLSKHDCHRSAHRICVDEIKELGRQPKGYTLGPLFASQDYQTLIDDLADLSNHGQSAITFLDALCPDYLSIHQRYEHIKMHVSTLQEMKHDASAILHMMRKTKDEHEISLIQKAIDITCNAHKAVAQTIKPGLYEYQVRSELEHVFTYQGAPRSSFPSIVATGRNTTVLHYSALTEQLNSGDLLVVDIGAEWGMYAADITRTFPVSGKFTDQQKNIYNIVLAVQEYVFSKAQPGMYLNNSKHPEQSLHHIACTFLDNAGYGNYFVHGIGHYLGLDVHDVGDYRAQLKPGDVFTIEPGIYMRSQNLGVRIEDDYVITEDGCRCLSNNFPKKLEEIEAIMNKLQ